LRGIAFSHDPLTFTVQVAVLAAWWVFAAAFLFRNSQKKVIAPGKVEQRDPGALAGVLLQGLGYATIWFVPRLPEASLLPVGSTVSTALMVCAPVIAFLSVWLVMSAIRALGKQWAVNARLLEGHALITSGPFSLMRHPIYAGMLGMLLATGMVVSEAWGLALALAFFLGGLAIRVRAEERLLARAFGPAFEEYRRAVPAVFPFVFRSGETRR
jgi:protein-S-isoprenylcysteine O-methyltransferase Ste14